jgi:hypothetical protein
MSLGRFQLLIEYNYCRELYDLLITKQDNELSISPCSHRADIIYSSYVVDSLCPCQNSQQIQSGQYVAGPIHAIAISWQNSYCKSNF